MRSLAILVLASGCHQVFGLGDPSLVLDDAAPADVALADMAADAQLTCIQRWMSPAGPVLGQPTPLTIANSASGESDPFLTADGLELYFSRSLDLYVSTRASLSAPFSAPVSHADLNSMANETKIFISPNKQRAYFASQRGGGSGGFDLWRAARDSPSSQWTTINQSFLSALNTTGDQHDPHLSSDLLRIYYAPATAGVQMLAVAERAAATDAFGAPVQIAELDLPGNQADPALTEDELVIVFASIAPNGTRDLYYATRLARTSPFSTPKPLTQLNTTTLQEAGPFLTADGCTLYFESTVSGAGDLFVTTVQ